jgi:hypothetical protein
MKKLSLIILLIIGLQIKAFAQNSINNYKYVIVPTSYSFLNEEDKYQLNSLTKFLFNKYGYTALLSNEELPQDLNKNRCLALYADVVNDKGLFKTKLKIDLKDCGGIIVMSSKVGETREKEFAKAYNLALRDAFETFQKINYSYEPSNNTVSLPTTSVVNENTEEKEKEIERLQEELKSLKEEKKMEPQKVEVPMPAVKEAETEVKEIETKANETKIEVKEATDLLYAQPIENGYQVVDTTPKIVMILLKTPQSNVYIVKDQDAIVYKEEGKWFLSKNDGNKVSIEALNIKF